MDRSLNDRQRVALAFLRHNERLANRDYRRLNHVDTTVASRELRGLVQTGLVEQHGASGGAYYTLSVPAEAPAPALPGTDEDRIIQHVRDRGWIANADCRRLLGVSQRRAQTILTGMVRRGLLRQDGTGRWTIYRLP